jgi:hypothetical protein
VLVVASAVVVAAALTLRLMQAASEAIAEDLLPLPATGRSPWSRT